MHITNLTKAIRDAAAAGPVDFIELNAIDVKRVRSSFGGGDDITGLLLPESGRHVIERDKSKRGCFHINGVSVSTDGGVKEGEWRIVMVKEAAPDPAPPAPEGDAA
jgi:hypothetical protein